MVRHLLFLPHFPVKWRNKFLRRPVQPSASCLLPIPCRKIAPPDAIQLLRIYLRPLYLPVVLLGFFSLARFSHAYAAGWLALASLFFYGYWNPAYIGLLLASIVHNYAFGTWIVKAGLRTEDRGLSVVRKKRLLIVAIAANLALLAYYKYANFFVDSISNAAGTQWSLGEIILPLGISFFTFTQIAFLVDTYQGKVKEYNFVHYLLFVTYFPHLIAGPVLHHREMMPQFAYASTYRVNWDHVATGLLLFTLGLCKKVLWADSLAPFATAIFDGTA